MRKMIAITLAIFAVVILFGMSVANAELVVIDFESLGSLYEGDTYTYFGSSSYQEDGYSVNTNSDFGFVTFDTVALFTRYLNDTVTLTKDDGAPFDFFSIDYTHVDSQPIDFIGTKNDNTLVYYTKVFDSENSHSTITFPDFTRLISVSWQGGGGYNHFDNLIIIPEPLTLVLFGIGAIALIRKNRL